MHRKTHRTRSIVLVAATVGGSLATAGSAASASAPDEGACAPEDITLIGQVRNETNPYEKAWLDGGDAFAESVGLEQKRLTYGGDSSTQQDQIRQELSTGNTACFVLNVLPNGDADTMPIVEATDEAGAWLVTQWNKPADLNPIDYPTWAAHITYDGQASGYMIAKALFDSMGGEGGVIALQGILDTSAAQDRFAGLQQALDEYPGITLLDEQTANFSREEALSVAGTLLTKHGDDVGGIWTANDDMALGAVQALQAEGRDDVGVVGIDAVPEAIAAIADGTMVATVSSDGPWQGGVGLAIGYCAAIGEIDLAAEPPEHRAFFAEQILISEDNVADFAEPTVDVAEFDCANVYSRVVSGLDAAAAPDDTSSDGTASDDTGA